MKSKFYIKLLYRFLFLLIASSLINTNGYGQLLMQNFSSSTTVSDYVSATPNNTQFTSISATAGSAVSIVGERLEFARATGGEGWFSRSVSFSTVPTTLMVQFNIEAMTTGGVQTTACLVKVGDGLNDVGTPLDPNANIFARFGINFTATAGQFSLRNIDAGTNSANFTGKQTVTFVMNRSGASLTYVAPTGTNKTLANNAYDVYIGATLFIDAGAALTPSVNLANFKFNFRPFNNNTSLRIDNIYINSLNGTGSLPSGAFSVGTDTGNFTSITNPGGVFNVLNNLGSIPAGGYTFQVTENLTAETGVNPLLQISGMGAGNPIKIVPASSGRLVSGNGNPLMNFNGADYVEIDGGNGGAYTGTNRLTIRQTANNVTLQFINDATNFTINDCVFESNSTSTNGTFFFSTGTTMGNDNITVQNCQIRNRTDSAPAGGTGTVTTTNVPRTAINSTGGAGTITNDNITFDNCEFINFFSASNNTNTVLIGNNTQNFTFKNNHVFQTVNFFGNNSFTTYSQIIQINGVNTNHITIEGNYFGGRAKFCGGGAFVFSNPNDNRCRLIIVRSNMASSTNLTIKDNTVANIRSDFQTTNTGGVDAFNGFIGSGKITIQNNTFSNLRFSQTTNGASPANAIIQCINYSGDGNGQITNNKIEDIQMSFALSPTHGFSFEGIRLNPVSAGLLVAENMIGSISNADNIIINAHNSINFLAAIHLVNLNACTIANNTIANITNNSTNTASTLYGINQAGVANNTITTNTIYNLSSASQQVNNNSTDNVTVAGIRINAATTNLSLYANQIYSIRGIATTNSTSAGIVLTGGVNGSIYNNRIYDITNTSNTTQSIAAGIVARNIGTALYIYNNRISLGLQPVTGSGTSNPNPAMYIGVWNNFSSPNKLYFIFNSVNIGGVASGGAYKTYAFFRGDNPWDALPDASLVTTPLQVYNNIFQNARTGGSGTHFAIGIQDVTTPDQAPCPTATTEYSPDYNVYYASNATKLGEVGGSAVSFTDWQTSFSPNIDTHSFDASPSSVPIAFVNVGIADMHLTVNDQRPDGKALPIATELGFPLTIDFDIDGEFRRSTDAGADELEQTMTFIGTSPNDNWHDPNNWLVVGSMPERNVVPNCADNVIVPSGKTVKVYNGGTQNPTNQPALFYTLTIQNGATVELQNGTVMNSCWYNDELPVNQVHKGEFLNNGIFIANGGTLNIAGRFTDNGNFQKGTSTVFMNKDRPTLSLECLEKYIHARNDDSNISNIAGTANTNFYNLVIYTNESLASNNTTKDDAFSGNTTIVGSHNIFVGDAVSDLGYLDIQGVNLGSGGRINLNGNKLTLEGDLTENNGTITGSITSKLHILGKANLTGTLKFTDVDSDGFEDFEQVVMNRPNNGLAVLDNKNLRISNIGFLDLSAGRLKTGVVPTTFEVNVTNANAGTSVINYNPLGYNNSGWVWGRLRRSIAGTASYKYPIGDGTRYQLIDIDITTALGTTANILGYFNPNDAPGSVNLTESSITYNSLCTNGFWEMTPNAQPNSGAFNINLFPVGIVCIGAPINFAKSPSGAGTYSFGGSSPVTPIKRSGFTNFSDITLISPSIILPVELLSFQAFAQEKSALLTWETVWERGNDYFEVQKSIDGKNFFAIGKVEGKGTSQSKNTYQFTDNEPFKGLNYYRLKQVDLDEKVNYSKIISLYFDGEEELLNIFPNPSNDLDVSILLSAKAGNLLHIKVIDAMGRSILTESRVYTGEKISLKSDKQITKGIYFVSLQNISTGKVQSKKLIVE